MSLKFTNIGKGHQLDYKGHTIYYENGIYWIAANPVNKVTDINVLKAEIDKVEDALNNNIVNIHEILKRNSTNYDNTESRTG